MGAHVVAAGRIVAGMAIEKILGLGVELIKEIVRLVMDFFDWGETQIGKWVDEILKIIDKLFNRLE